MRRLLPLAAALLLLFGALYSSCKKEYSCEHCPLDASVLNQVPIANAGPDQKITLPKDSALLDGSSSIDLDGKITGFQWRRIAGPGSLLLVQPTGVKTMVKGLVTGVHEIELKVTDNKGASGKDTVLLKVSLETGITRYTRADTLPG